MKLLMLFVLFFVMGCSTLQSPPPAKTQKVTKPQPKKAPVKYKNSVSQNTPPKKTALSPAGAVAPHELAEIDIKRNNFVLLKSLPKRISDIEKRFGEKAKITQKTIPNHHNQSMDYVMTLQFNGAVLEVYKNNIDKNSDTILSMVLTKPKNIDLPLNVGMLRQDVENYLEVKTHNEPTYEICELQEITPSGPIHSSACTKFNFKKDTISEIDWIIPFD